MPERAPFVRKLLKTLDRVDRPSIEKYLLELAEKTETYKSVLNHLNEGVVLVTDQGSLLFINQAASLWLGLQPGTKACLWDAVADPEFARFTREYLDGRKARTVKDLHLLCPRDMYVRAFFIPLDQGETLVLLTNRDEPKGREFDEERIFRIESLVNLAAGIAHEIGNPLNSIVIHLQLLKKDLKDLPEARRKSMGKTLSVLNSETERLDRIVKNFLKATRKPPLRFQSEDLNALVEEAVSVMAPELKASRVRVDFRPDRELRPFLVDRERLHQVFINLIKNAKEAMPEGGLLKIAISHRENMAILVFQDSGVGIRERDLPRIFDAYFTTKKEGSGLGLLAVYNAVREHSGRIEVASKTGKGTTFTFFLPMRRPRLQLVAEKILGET